MVKIKSILPIEGTELVKIQFVYGSQRYSKVVRKEVEPNEVLIQENEALKVKHGNK